jgi:3-phenylpropionate/cinnamic acid dioxygenase small subunit
VEAADRIELHELASLYGDLIDARDWDGLTRVFTHDVVYANPTLPGRDLHGIDMVRKFMGRGRHPLAHHITNIRVEEDEDGVHLRSRVLLVSDDGLVRSGQYADDVTSTPEGWRIARRSFTIRVRPDTDTPA